MVTACVPAASTSLGSGFGAFGVTLDRPVDIVRVERADRTTVEMTGVGSQYIPTDPDRNVVGVATEVFDAPVHIRIDKGVHPLSGLGSSTASSAAAVAMLNGPYDHSLSREEFVPAAIEDEAVISGETHADSVAPALLGSFIVAADEGVATVDADIPFVACLPEVVVSTRDTHRVVSNDASIEDMIHTVGRVATLMVGICCRDAGFVGAGMDDRVVASAWAKLISGYHDIREAALATDATGVTVSGAGPSALGVCRATSRTRVAGAILEVFDEAGVAARAYKIRVSRRAGIFES